MEIIHWVALGITVLLIADIYKTLKEIRAIETKSKHKIVSIDEEQGK